MKVFAWVVTLFLLTLATAANAAPAGEPPVLGRSFPFPSADQTPTVRPRLVETTRDRGMCISNVRCFCDTWFDQWGNCAGGSTCRASQGGYCAYDCYNPGSCHTMTDAMCESWSEACNG